MKKRMEINIVDMIKGKSYSSEYFNSSVGEHVDETYWAVPINKNEYPNIFLDHEITDEEFDNALNVLITHLMQKQVSRVFIDLETRDASLAPAKEMTLEEIEKHLGHKVKIVNKEVKK